MADDESGDCADLDANGDGRVSPDGRYVVYVNSADRNLWLLELAE
ncbi:MAG TPA: hypothetical protein VJ754_03630 [Anaerolineae bacterium]|nr:hypothetical protein [Anaerolineae bacterium]